MNERKGRRFFRPFSFSFVAAQDGLDRNKRSGELESNSSPQRVDPKKSDREVPLGTKHLSPPFQPWEHERIVDKPRRGGTNGPHEIVSPLLGLSSMVPHSHGWNGGLMYFVPPGLRSSHCVKRKYIYFKLNFSGEQRPYLLRQCAHPNAARCWFS